LDHASRWWRSKRLVCRRSCSAGEGGGLAVDKQIWAAIGRSEQDAEPGGWAFEYRDYYPDVDDTAFVLMALQRVKFPDEKRMECAVRRGIQWLLSMQNRDGGWGAFDRDNDRQILCNIPFADHNAMIDPSTADVTARVLECLGRFGWPAELRWCSGRCAS
jgi:squalene cyclase